MQGRFVTRVSAVLFAYMQGICLIKNLAKLTSQLIKGRVPLVQVLFFVSCFNKCVLCYVCVYSPTKELRQSFFFFFFWLAMLDPTFAHMNKLVGLPVDAGQSKCSPGST